MANMLQGLLSNFQNGGSLLGSPEENPLYGILSGGVAPGTPNLVSAQLMSNAFTSAADNKTTFGGIPEAAQAQYKLNLAQKEVEREQEERAQVEQQRNMTRELFQREAPDLIPWMDAGMTSEAFAEFSRRKQPQARRSPIEINGQLVDPDTYQVLGDFRDQNSGMPAAPSGYMWNPDGTQTYIPGGPADPSTQARTTEAQRRNQQLASVIEPELQNVEANWGALTEAGNQAGGMIPGVGNMFTSPQYQQATRSLAVIAQSYLYSVSGAAATDAEVQKIVDSVTPKPFESPESVADKKRRIQQMADAVIQAGGGGQQQPAPNGQTSSGVQWSIEP